MTEQTEFFYQALCFTPIWGILDLLLILHFFISWMRSAVKTGWKIDFWFLTLSLSVFPSLCILYPFNASIFNAPFIMGFYEKILPLVDQAFLISALGYVSLWIGRYLFDLSRGLLPIPFFFQATQPLCQLVESNVKSKRGYLFIACTAIFLGLIILLIQFKEDYFFNARSFFLKEPILRPLFNFTISIFPIAFAFLSLRFIQLKEKRCLIFFTILFLMALFFGVRSLALGGFLVLMMYWIFYREGRFSIFKLIGICSLMFLCAVILGDLREGRFNPLSSFSYALINLVYGNNFSDIRDFAWILAFWDGEYLYGKTYVAAFLSFIPRALSPLREEWSISMYTNAITGFDSDLMPGLRPGIFGEAFLNFSYIGVIGFGLTFGAALRFSDLKIKEHVARSKDIIKGYSHLIAFTLISCLSVSASLWSFYTFLLLNTALVLVRGPVKKQDLSEPIY